MKVKTEIGIDDNCKIIIQKEPITITKKRKELKKIISNTKNVEYRKTLIKIFLLNLNSVTFWNQFIDEFKLGELGFKKANLRPGKNNLTLL